MRNRFKTLIASLKFNGKSILLFESIYRIIGVAIIFPLGNQLLLLSVRLTGKLYITDASFFDYIFRPSTVLLFILFFFVIAVYVFFEIIALSILFHLSEQGQKITMQALFVSSFRRLKTMVKHYHILILLSTMTFFLLVEGFHIVGIASTISLPRIIVNEFETVPILRWFVFGFAFILIVLFIETIFFELQSVLTNNSLKDIFKEQKQMLHKNRFKLVIEFLLINILLNVVLYAMYLLVIWMVTLIAQLFVNTSAVFGVLLSIMYIIYLIIGFIGTIFIVPINFAWINTWYYSFHPVHNSPLFQSQQKEKRFIKPALKRVLVGFAIVLAGVNIFLIRDTLINPNTPLQLLNKPQIVAHRGSSLDAPENTIAAIEQAIEDGSDAVEIDVRFTSDGVPILMHDAKLSRTTNLTNNQLVKETTYEEIRKLDAGSWFDSSFQGEVVPTLEEALLTAKRRVTVYIELKALPPGGIETITELLEETNMVEFVKILSFDEDILYDFKELNSNTPTVLLLATFLGDLRTLGSYDYVDYIAIRYQLIQNNKDYVQELQERGKEVYVFTVNTDALIREMDNYGVNGLITDAPIKARELVYSENANDWFNRLLQELFSSQ